MSLTARAIYILRSSSLAYGENSQLLLSSSTCQVMSFGVRGHKLHISQVLPPRHQGSPATIYGTALSRSVHCNSGKI